MQFPFRAITCTIFTLVLFVCSCTSPSEPEFKELANVRFVSVSLSKPMSVILQADAIMHNPNALGAKVTEMDFDVYINDRLATHVKQDVEAAMPARSDFTLPFECSIPLKEVLGDLKISEILTLRTLRYKLDGHLKIGLGNVEIKLPLAYAGEEPIR